MRLVEYGKSHANVAVRIKYQIIYSELIRDMILKRYLQELNTYVLRKEIKIENI